MFFACQKVVEVKVPDHVPQNVMNVILSEDSLLGGYLYESVSVLSNDSFKPVYLASMKAFDNNNTQVAYQLLSNTGAYFSSNVVKSNECYQIEFNSNIGTSTGTCCIPSKPNILAVDTLVQNQLGDTVLNIKIKFKDSANFANYYRFTCLVNQVFNVKAKMGGGFDTTWKWVQKSFSTNNFNLFVNEYNYSNAAYLLKDENMDGNEIEATFFISIKNIPKAKEVLFYVDAIDNNLFNYYRTLSAQQFFGTDPNAHYIKVFSNVKNGYGIVGGQSRFSYTYVIR